MMSDGNTSQSSRTGATNVDGGISGDEFMLFGVRVRVDPMRKSVSLNNLSQYELPKKESSNTADVPAAGYASADEATVHHQSSGSRERKRGVPWTEEEHKLFLLGLQKVGKGDWRGISRNFVKTRTPTQVASHAQKYFLRRSNLNRRRRRSSLFDITTESVTAILTGEKAHQEHIGQPHLPPPQHSLTETSAIGGNQFVSFPVTVCPVSAPLRIDNSMEPLTLGHVGHVDQCNSAEHVHPLPVLLAPANTGMVDLNSNERMLENPSPLLLNLSLSLNQAQEQFSRHPAFELLPSISNGDSMISVA